MPKIARKITQKSMKKKYKTTNKKGGLDETNR